MPALTPMEIRVIGCLIEKQITTPEQYPLSLNSLSHACNQKSNRDPVLDSGEVGDAEGSETLAGLQRQPADVDPADGIQISLELRIARLEAEVADLKAQIQGLR